MSRPWGDVAIGPFRAAAAEWLGVAIASLSQDRSPTRLKTVVSRAERNGDGAIGMRRHEVLDCYEAADRATRRTLETPAFVALQRAAVARRDVFDDIPDLDAAGSDESRLHQRDWVLSSVARPLLTAYLERATTPSHEAELVETLLDQIEAELRASSTPFCLYAPLECLGVDEPIEILAGVRLRPATNEDRGYWFDLDGDARHRMTVLDLSTVLEVDYEEPKGGPGVLEGRRAQDTVRVLEIALQLALNCDAQARYVQFRREATFGVGFGGKLWPAPHEPRVRSTLRSADVAAVRQLVTLLGSSPNLTRCAIALRRWASICAGGPPDDHVVDAWVGLESLLVAGKSTGELSYRASVRLAVMIGTDGADRGVLYPAIRKSYEVRSKVLHGADTRRVDLAAEAARARDYLRRALIAVLRAPSGFDPDGIEERLLQSEL